MHLEDGTFELKKKVVPLIIDEIFCRRNLSATVLGTAWSRSCLLAFCWESLLGRQIIVSAPAWMASFFSVDVGVTGFAVESWKVTGPCCARTSSSSHDKTPHRKCLGIAKKDWIMARVAACSRHDVVINLECFWPASCLAQDLALWKPVPSPFWGLWATKLQHHRNPSRPRDSQTKNSSRQGFINRQASCISVSALTLSRIESASPAGQQR